MTVFLTSTVKRIWATLMTLTMLVVLNSCEIAPDAEQVKPQVTQASDAALHFQSEAEAQAFFKQLRDQLNNPTAVKAAELQKRYQEALPQQQQQLLQQYEAENEMSSLGPIDPGTVDPYDPGDGTGGGGPGNGGGGFSVDVIPHINSVIFDLTWANGVLTGVNTHMGGFNYGTSVSNTWSDTGYHNGGFTFHTNVLVTYTVTIEGHSFTFTEMLQAEVYYNPYTHHRIVRWH